MYIQTVNHPTHTVDVSSWNVVMVELECCRKYTEVLCMHSINLILKHNHYVIVHPQLPCTATFPTKQLCSPAFVCGDVDNPETRADGELGERGKGPSELGIAVTVLAVGEPVKL